VKLDSFSSECGRAKDEIALLDRALVGVRLEYEPQPGFDCSKVSGIVSRLVTIRNGCYNVAVEAFEDARLYNIITEDDDTPAALLGFGVLPH
jgi:hypothetical protein